jgi:hypothetical protein
MVWYVLPILTMFKLPTLLQLDGTASPCVTTELLEGLPDGDKRAEQEQIAKNCAGVAYVGTHMLLYFRLIHVLTRFQVELILSVN